jgi:hypothetical protein
MDARNAFLRKRDEPTEAEVASALGPTMRLWKELIEGITTDAGRLKQEWQGIFVNKYGWTLRLKQRGRSIVYLAPCKGCFRVAFALNDKAVKAAKAANLPKKVADALAAAPRYLEGTGLRLMVHKASDLAAIRKLAQIKLAS